MWEVIRVACSCFCFFLIIYNVYCFHILAPCVCFFLALIIWTSGFGFCNKVSIYVRFVGTGKTWKHWRLFCLTIISHWNGWIEWYTWTKHCLSLLEMLHVDLCRFRCKSTRWGVERCQNCQSYCQRFWFVLPCVFIQAYIRSVLPNSKATCKEFSISYFRRNKSVIELNNQSSSAFWLFH